MRARQDYEQDSVFEAMMTEAQVTIEVQKATYIEHAKPTEEEVLTPKLGALNNTNGL